MLIYPAIDLRQGKCVRLKQGERRREMIYSEDPLATAAAFIAEGATWLHVIDLDGAFAAERNNRAIIKKMAAGLAVRIQCGGGLRTLADMAELLDAGVSRIILGTVAVRQPELVRLAVKKFGASAVAVAIDARDGEVAVAGWEKNSGITALELAQQLGESGVELAIYTDIARDGMLSGINLPALQNLLNGTNLCLIASGGVRDVNDLKFLQKLHPPRLEGVIIGRALYEGTIRLFEAVNLFSEK